MTVTTLVRPAASTDDFAAVRGLCRNYRAFMMGLSDPVRRGVEIAYPATEYENVLRRLPEIHARPKGQILLAEQDGHIIGCGMYHGLTDADVEFKRVYIEDQARGTGAGLAVSQALIDHARADGYSRVLLDTSREFATARRLYEKLGFTQRGPYAELSQEFRELLVFYELPL